MLRCNERYRRATERRGRIAALILSAVCASCASCDHEARTPPGGESAPSKQSDAQASNSDAGGNSGSDTGAQERCIVETPTEPTPEAEAADECPADPGTTLEMPRSVVRFVEAPGAPPVTVELASTQAARMRGLMYRTQMAENEGMLFSWPDERLRSFWMRNTCIPLDMLFIAQDLTIVGMLEEVPVLNEEPRQIPCPAMHVLEVNAGFARRHGIVAGQHVELETPDDP